MQTKIHLLTPLSQSTQGKTSTDVSSQIQNLCIEHHLNCTDVHVNNDNTVTVTLDRDEQVIFSLQKDLQTQIASLQLTIAHLTIDGKRFHRFDFRFEKPVISY